MIIAGAMAFGFVHINFRNWLAAGLCAIGGLLFPLTYETSGSLPHAGLDRAIFGNFLFTIGLGNFCYHGSGTGFPPIHSSPQTGSHPVK